MKFVSLFHKFVTLQLFLLASILDVSALNVSPNDTMLIKKSNLYNGIQPIFSSLSGPQLLVIIQNQDVNGAIGLYSSVGANVASYLESVYNEEFYSQLDPQPEAMVVLGLFRWAKEKNIGLIPITPEQSFAPDDDKALSCFITAVGTVIGVAEISSIYNDFVRGVSPRTILKTLKFALKKVASAWTIATTIYALGDCLDWW